MLDVNKHVRFRELRKRTKIKCEMFYEVCLTPLSFLLRCGWAEPHKVDGGIRQQRQHRQDATGRVHIRQEGQDVVLRHRGFDPRRRTHHGGRTVWHPEAEVQLTDQRDRGRA